MVVFLIAILAIYLSQNLLIFPFKVAIPKIISANPSS